jgi:hypothetical protein
MLDMPFQNYVFWTYAFGNGYPAGDGLSPAESAAEYQQLYDLTAYLLTRCNNTCVDARFDENNCGACGVVCPGNRQCNNGTCGPP